MSFSDHMLQVAVDPSQNEPIGTGEEINPPGILRVIFDKVEPHPNLWHEFITPQSHHEGLSDIGASITLVGDQHFFHD